MSEKLPAPIEKLTLTDVPFCRQEVTPTRINFIYGRNGAGKSVMARAIREGRGVQWRQDSSASDYRVLVYDQFFVSRNFRSYGNLPGVFTIGERNAALRERTEKLEAAIAGKRQALKENAEEQRKLDAARNAALESFQDTFWNRTGEIRGRYPETQTGYKRDRAKVAAHILSINKARRQDLGYLDRLYSTAFDKNARTYPLFQCNHSFAHLKAASRGFALLRKPITSSSDSPFSDFLKQMNALPWVMEGHSRYQHAAGDRCPYCQQTLPVNFEMQLAACYDEQYRQDIAALGKYRDAYEEDMRGFVAQLQANLEDACPNLDLAAYRDKTALLEKVITINLQIIDGKLKDPASVVELEGIRDLLSELQEMTEFFNRQIRENNVIAEDQAAKKRECTAMVWQHMTFLMRESAGEFRRMEQEFQKKREDLEKKAAALRSEIQNLQIEQKKLGVQDASAEPAVENINRILQDAGFRRFHIEQQPNSGTAYRVIRSDGRIAENLSEGERNFLAFLYFYQMVWCFSPAKSGNPNSLVAGSGDTLEEEQLDFRPRIVVIDDPVSGLDADALSVVSSLIQEMIADCKAYPDESLMLSEDPENSGDSEVSRYPGKPEIRQLFVLTHNPGFFRDVSNGQQRDFRAVNFYFLRKMPSASFLQLCTRPRADSLDEDENYSPVMDSYSALWEEYRAAQQLLPVISVTRRILKSFFVQTCGYSMSEIRKRVLVENRERFVAIREDGSEDGSEDSSGLRAASVMLVSSTGEWSDEGGYVTGDAESVELYREIFRDIFEVMEQERHYEKMLGSAPRYIAN